ncbi:FAD-binding oxidoreductase [Tropicimonas sp. S265A]|uniref:FAD-binding oxidoreductase n=1 Tax=Tropicimonas sp. S265A TaxID=3415134 RepID=UPI003C7CBBF7
MTHRVALQSTLKITPDTTYYTFDRPEGYSFVPGEATELAIDHPDWRDEKRPFTFVSDPDANILAFVIKSYPERDGVTAHLPSLNPGDHVLLDDPWGAIRDSGPGVFIAAGAGITPFIGILKARARRRDLNGCRLIFGAKTRDDIILKHFWCGLQSLETNFVLSDPRGAEEKAERIDGDFLDTYIEDWDQRFYVCGPPEFEEDIVSRLKSRGVPDERIVREE